MIDVSLSALVSWSTDGALALSVLLIVVGLYILNRRDLELGALIGLYPLLGGVIIGAITGLAWLVYFINHVHFTP